MIRTILFIGIILFVSSGCDQQKKVADTTDYIKVGDSIAAKSFDHLRTALQASMSADGPAAAITFCRQQAMPLTSKYNTDSITVMRVAEKFRNPSNALKNPDSTVWSQYKTAMANGDSIFSKTVVTDTAIHYYKPILLLPLCSTCHGVAGKDIPASLVTVIDSLYPGDRAKDFLVGELRGMWHIRFDK